MAVHFRGGTSRGTNLHWEINGTDGDLVVSGPSGLETGRVTIHGGRDSATGLSALTVPDDYHRISALAGEQDAPGYVVACAYMQLLDDLDASTSLVPDFDHAVRRHRTIEAIEAIEHAAATGERQPASPG